MQEKEITYPYDKKYLPFTEHLLCAKYFSIHFIIIWLNPLQQAHGIGTAVTPCFIGKEIEARRFKYISWGNISSFIVMLGY
jgi:hypothetical protein